MGSPHRFRRGTPLEVKFYAQLIPRAEGCWLWTGPQSWNGYGLISVGSSSRTAHRVGYELHKGPVPRGREIHHECHNRLCVNPDHLRAVTRSENMRDPVTRERQSEAQRKTRCPKGHLKTPENTRVTPQGWKICLTCRRENWRRQNRKRAEASS